MAVINPKQLRISVPQEVNSMLEKSLKHGEGWIVSKMHDRDEDKEFYVLPGLYIRNLSEANITDETAGKLDNGLNSGSITYVVYPNDRRNGFIPIVFDKDTKFYFEEQLQELFESDQVLWYLYKVPVDVDSDNNERVGAEMIRDTRGSNEPITIDYDEIESKLRQYGRVNADTRDEMFDTSVEETDRKNKELEEQLLNEKKDYLDFKQNVDKKSIDQRVEDIEQNVDDDHQEEDNIEDVDSEETVDDNLNEEPPEMDENQTLAGLFDDVIVPEDENESIESENLGSLDMFDETDNDNLDNNDTTDNETIKTDETYDKYKNQPEDLQKLLDKIRLPRFETFVGKYLEDETRDQINHSIATFNSSIEALENNIKDKAITLYESDMNDSYKTVKEYLDTEKGDSFVRERYNAIEDEINQLREDAKQKSQDYLRELEDDFNNRQYEAYKAEILAQLPQKFKDEYYGERVLLPSEDFEMKQNEEAETKAREIRNDFDDWRANLEETTITADQQRAINHVKSTVNNDIQESMNQLEEYRVKLEKEKNTLQSQDHAKRMAKEFEDRLKEESVQNVLAAIEAQYGPQIAEQAKNLKSLKEKQEKEKESYELNEQKLKHEYQLKEEELKRKTEALNKESMDLERKRQLMEEQQQRQLYQQPIVQPQYQKQEPVKEVETQKSDNTSSKEKAKGFGEKKLTLGQRIATGVFGGLLLLGFGGFAGYEIYDLGHHDYATQEQKLQQQVNNDNTNKSTNNSNDSSDSLPYLNDGNVSVPKDNYSKGDKIEYKDKQYDIESVTKDRLEVKDSNGKEYQVPIKDE